MTADGQRAAARRRVLPTRAVARAPASAGLTRARAARTPGAPRRTGGQARRAVRAVRVTRPRPRGPSGDVGLGAFQRQIEALYGRRDRARGLAETFMWFTEEVGELSRALRSTERSGLSEEFADVLAWLVTLASMAGVRMPQAARRYTAGCPRCFATPCACRRRTQVLCRK